MTVDRREAQRQAEAAADAVGDGAVVLRHDPSSGRVQVCAVAHRDPQRRRELEQALGQQRPTSGWEAQVLSRSVPLRIEAAPALTALALPGTSVAAAMLLPWRESGESVGLIAALRDHHRPYTRQDQAVAQAALLDPAAPMSPPIHPSRLLDLAQAGVWVTDSDGCTIYANEPLSRLLAVPLGEIAGRPMADFIDEVPRLVRGYSSDDSEPRDHRLVRPDGKELWVTASSVPLTDAEGRRTGTITTVADVTKRKLAEVELRMRLAGNEAIAELADWALAGEPVENLIHGVAAAVADLLDAEHVAVVEALAAGERVVPRAAVGWDPAYLGQTIGVAPGSAVAVALEGEDPILVRDLTADASPFEPSPAAIEAGMRSAVFIAVGDGLGLITAHSSRLDAFGDRDLHFLRALADVLATRWEARPPDLVTL